MTDDPSIELVGLSDVELGATWGAFARQRWPHYRRWYLSQGEDARPTYLACRRALQAHMPEFLNTYDRAVELAGGSDLVARCLSGYCPPPFITGCSQAVFQASGAEPILIRNYDYSVELWEAAIYRSCWAEQTVVGMSDCMLGLLDGINSSGLAVSLAFGGREVVGTGFGMPTILRYVLEVCQSTADAVELLTTIPSHMAYNVSVLDSSGTRATVLVSPDRAPSVSEMRVVTNHQHRVEWERHAAATGTVDRLIVLNRHVQSPDETESRFVRRFLEPPVFSNKHRAGMGTLYTAVYRPSALLVSYLWPTHRWDAGIDGVLEGSLVLDFAGARPRLPREESSA